MDAELWGPAADIVGSRAQKGTTILVDGPIEQDNFTGKDGTKRTRYKIRVDFFQLGSGTIQGERVASSTSSGGDFAEPF